jgi:hypothetical protein
MRDVLPSGGYQGVPSTNSNFLAMHDDGGLQRSLKGTFAATRGDDKNAP